MASLGNCRGSGVRSRGSQVKGSQVESVKSRVEGRMSRVRKSRSTVKSKGSKFKCLYVSYHSKERSIFVGTCWLEHKINRQAIESWNTR